MRPPGTGSARTARGFDRLAPVYDTLADLAFAGRIHASQIGLLGMLPPVRRALVVGGGTGRFLTSFLAHDPRAQAVSIDLSPRMTGTTAARLASQGFSDRVDLRVGGLERLGREERFDLVVTHCFLDLFRDSDLAMVIDSLNQSLEAGGHWLFSDFDASGDGLGGFARRSIVATLYAFFRTTCAIEAHRLPDFDRALLEGGLDPVAEATFLSGLLRASLLRKSAGDSAA